MAQLRKHDHTLDGSDWDLSSLSLKETPIEELKRNPKARKIDLSNNSLIRLPPSFTSLRHLVSLDLSKNGLTELPEDFGALNKLIRLDLYGNQLKSLPVSFADLVRLKWLDLKGNPLDSTLAKYSGDCANQRQCELCAINVIKFMKYEKNRIAVENRNEEQKRFQRIEFEKQLQEKNRKEKEKKKAKNARRTARKAQQSIDDNESDVANQVQTQSDATVKEKVPKSGSSFGVLLLGFLRVLLTISLICVLIFISIAIGLHLQNGYKLETFSDLKIALINAFSKLKDYKLFISEVSILFKALIKSLQNWRQIFDIFDNKLTGSEKTVKI